MGLSVFTTRHERAGRRPPRGLSATLLLIWGCGACAPEPVTIKSSHEFVPQSITSVAIAPFHGVKRKRESSLTFRALPPSVLESSEVHQSIHQSLGNGSMSPVPQRFHVLRGSVPDAVPDMIRHMVYSQLRLDARVDIVPPEAVEQILDDQDAPARARDRQEIVRLLGQRLAVDAVLEGSIRVYREREGTKFGALPAAVGFEIRLRRVRDGVVLWTGDYFEEQKPLTHDFKGFFERKGRFLTAEELARAGVARVLHQLRLGTD